MNGYKKHTGWLSPVKAETAVRGRKAPALTESSLSGIRKSIHSGKEINKNMLNAFGFYSVAESGLYCF
jgi:hypothetical protein